MFDLRYTLKDVQERAESYRKLASELAALAPKIKNASDGSDVLAAIVELARHCAAELADCYEYLEGERIFYLPKKPGRKLKWTDDFLVRMLREKIEPARLELAKRQKGRVTDRAAVKHAVLKDKRSNSRDSRYTRVIENILKQLPKAKRLAAKGKSIREKKS